MIHFFPLALLLNVLFTLGMETHFDVSFDIIKTVMLGLLGVVIFFLKKILGQFDKNTNKINEMSFSIAMLEKDVKTLGEALPPKEEWATLKIDLSNALKEFSLMRERIEQVPVIASHLKTAFTKIDELKTEISEIKKCGGDQEKINNVLRERSHLFANKLTIILYHLQKLGCQVDTNFEIPKID